MYSLQEAQGFSQCGANTGMRFMWNISPKPDGQFNPFPIEMNVAPGLDGSNVKYLHVIHVSVSGSTSAVINLGQTFCAIFLKWISKLKIARIYNSEIKRTELNLCLVTKDNQQ